MMRTWLLLCAVVALTLAAQSTHASSSDKDATCGSHDDEDCQTPNTASLLQKQKVFKHNVKSTAAQEPVDPMLKRMDDGCNGTAAQGRCWFLSDMGESCASTCAKQGRAFFFAVANPDEPLTPRLVGHKPQTKQEPWAALECYSPSEDRYHPVNVNSARHSTENVGNWTNEECKLACPCGAPGSNKCTWKQPEACSPKFMWKSVEYSGCATIDMEHESPWCQYNYEHTDKDADSQDWAYCMYSCEGDEPAAPTTTPAPPAPPAVRPKEPENSTCGWFPAASCVNLFSYKGYQYAGCTDSDSELTEATPWCSNTENYYGSWSKCVYSCVQPTTTPEPTGPSTLNAIYPGDLEEQCTWLPKNGSGCVKTFQYKGGNVTGCTDLDHPTPWCSKDATHWDSWDTCTRVCAKVDPAPAPAPEVVPVPAPVPVPASFPVPPRTPITNPEDPCYRRPDLENDAIGNSVTLDQVGFNMATSTLSPINMKRFVCRVVSKIGCRVVEAPALLGFVPYWRDRVNNDYSSLESELNTLCRGVGKWVAPRGQVGGAKSTAAGGANAAAAGGAEAAAAGGAEAAAAGGAEAAAAGGAEAASAGGAEAAAAGGAEAAAVEAE